MFHRVTDASKVAFWATVELLKLDGATLFDVQWTTPHLRSLGAVDVERGEYLRLLASARMEPVQIFHNPSCSKSRGALEILQERGVDARSCVTSTRRPTGRPWSASSMPSPTIRSPSCAPMIPSSRLPASRRSDVQTRAQVIEVLLQHPEVMERPVVFVGDRAVIARPSEKVLELLDRA